MFAKFIRCAALMAPASGGTALWGQSAGFAYVANCGSACGGGAGDISAYAIDGTTGALTQVAGSPLAPGTNPVSATVDPTGQFACVANAGSSDISAYTINRTTGVLTPVGGWPFPAGGNPNVRVASKCVRGKGW